MASAMSVKDGIVSRRGRACSHGQRCSTLRFHSSAGPAQTLSSAHKTEANLLSPLTSAREWLLTTCVQPEIFTISTKPFSSIWVNEC